MLIYLPIEMFSERSTDPIQSNWIRAGIYIAQTKSKDSRYMPKSVVIIRSIRKEIKKQHEQMRGKETYREYQDEN